MADAPSAPTIPRLAERAGAMMRAGALAAWDVPAEALAMRRDGQDIILLTLGDPEGPPHPAIIEAAQAALAAGRTHYAPLAGEPALRAAVAERIGCAAACVTIVPGARHGVFAAIQMLAGPGDEVILTDPHYATYPGVVAASGARAVPIRVRAADFGLDREAVAAAVSPATRALLFSSPANPTGAALDAADFAFLADLCRARNLWLVVDETYRDFAFASAHVSARDAAAAERTVVAGTLSKSHAMTGFRIGWVAGPSGFAQAMEEWCAAATFGVAQFVQDAGVAALALPDGALAGYRAGFRERAALVVARLNRIPGVAARMPDGGMFVMADVRAVDADDVALARRLLRTAGVAVVPGSGFGPGGSGHLRLSLTPPVETLDRALDAIARALAR
ncbi:MAG: pyridoxal phosphate-dependent aminotransferase [Thermaurantiacus sp.]